MFFFTVTIQVLLFFFNSFFYVCCTGFAHSVAGVVLCHVYSSSAYLRHHGLLNLMYKYYFTPIWLVTSSELLDINY